MSGAQGQGSRGATGVGNEGSRHLDIGIEGLKLRDRRRMIVSHVWGSGGRQRVGMKADVTST